MSILEGDRYTGCKYMARMFDGPSPVIRQQGRNERCPCGTTLVDQFMTDNVSHLAQALQQHRGGGRSFVQLVRDRCFAAYALTCTPLPRCQGS